MAVILGMGNPLLDISDNVDKALMEKYGLEPGGIILAEEKHQPLFAEMAKRPGVQYIAGGATQNSIRVAQWMLQSKGATAYMGCVGKDANAETMKACCEKDGVTTSYMVDEATPTGSCACLIEGIERSLCTNLCAANNFKIDHVKKAENMKLVQGSKDHLQRRILHYSVHRVHEVGTSRSSQVRRQVLLKPLSPVLDAGASVQVLHFGKLANGGLPLLQRDRGSNIRRDRRMGDHRLEVHRDTPLLDP